MRRPLYIANWKMNKTEFEARDFLRDFLGRPPAGTRAEIALAPPFTSLRTVGETLSGSGVALAAQDLHWEAAGAFTGEISGRMLADLGVRYVLVGHSERRTHFGDNDERVARKAAAARAAGLVAVVCIGESESQRESGRTAAVIETQLRRALEDLRPVGGGELVLAYEPVWAIGTGKVATVEQVAEAHGLLREILGSAAGGEVAARTRILYGGSATPRNIEAIAACAEVDGCLVGGASLDPASFRELIEKGAAAGGERATAPP